MEKATFKDTLRLAKYTEGLIAADLVKRGKWVIQSEGKFPVDGIVMDLVKLNPIPYDVKAKAAQLSNGTIQIDGKDYNKYKKNKCLILYIVDRWMKCIYKASLDILPEPNIIRNNNKVKDNQANQAEEYVAIWNVSDFYLHRDLTDSEIAKLDEEYYTEFGNEIMRTPAMLKKAEEIKKLLKVRTKINQKEIK